MKHSSIAAILFVLTYSGVALGTVPGLAIDRTGIALLGAIAMVVTGTLSTREAVEAVDVSTILLLYGLMILSAQFRLGGFYSRAALALVRFMDQPRRFLLMLMLTAAAMSALLANDIVCLAFTPVLCVSLLRNAYNPIPFLIGLACASNIGSAATIIGNPQNMLIGQLGKLHFGDFTLWCTPPSVVSLLAAYMVIAFVYRGRWRRERPVAGRPEWTWPDYDAHQSIKGLVLTGVLLAMFCTAVPRELSAMAVAGLILCSRKMATRSILGLVDWQLMTLFCALFIVVKGATKYGLAQEAFLLLESYGASVNGPLTLSTVTLLLSNVVSNVPAVMLLLNHMDLGATKDLYLLGLISTYAGNLLTIGSIANLITIEQARSYGVSLGAKEHARIGIPVTCISVTIALAWMAFRS